MSVLFQPLPMFEKVPAFPFPGLTTFAPQTPPVGAWPSTNGGATRNSRSADPLVHDQWTVQWEAPLGDAASPDSLLVGRDRIVVNGPDRRGLWTAADGRNLAFVRRELGTAFLDVSGERLLLAEDGGFGVYGLDGQRQAAFLLSLGSGGTLKEILAGPEAFVFVTVDRPAHGAAEAIVSTFRITDYGRIDDGILYGVQPLAGISRDEDASVTAAAGKDGPVLATRKGVLWCDWQLRTRHEFLDAAFPGSLSVDDQDRAYLLIDEGGEVRFRIIPPGGPLAVDVALPGRAYARTQPPIIAPSGQAYLTAPDRLMAISASGQILWQQDRASSAAGSISRNGLLLIADDATLYAITPDGKRLPLWRAPAAIITAPVLAGERLYVATADTLYVLRPTVS